jgi:hypothetical protein
MLAYCGIHHCYVCPKCDFLSECIDSCKAGELVDYKDDGQGVHWEWEEFISYKEERLKIYQYLLTLAKGWPSLKQAIDSYCGQQAASQPEAAENMYADASYFNDALDGLKLAFTNLKLDEIDEIEFEQDENPDDLEHLDDDDDNDDENWNNFDGYGFGGPYGGGRGDDSWGVPNRRRNSKGSRKDYEEAKYFVTRPPIPYCTRVTVTEILTKGFLDEGTMVHPFVKDKEEKGEKGTIRVRDEDGSGFA